MRPTYAQIDLSAIRHNATEIGRLVAPAELCAVVKADGYGHGDAPVATAALDGGVTRLAVALVEEGIRLREAGIDAPVLVLSQPEPGDAIQFEEWNLVPSVYNTEFVEALDQSGYTGGVHINVDTGMHRVGVSPDGFPILIESIRAAGLDIEGLYTHFPVADTDPEFTRTQIDLFDSIIEGVDAPLIHLANTPGALLFPESRRDFVRIGLGLYGLHYIDATRDLVDLRPAMSILSHVSHVQQLEAGARPSYGRRRALDSASTVVTIPIGYADGLWRGLSDSGRALIGGESFPFVGTVTMDQTMVEVGDADVDLGDEVVLIGTQGASTISVDEWAKALGTISHEIVCSIGPRVPRRYSS